jgi:hypothetical protein
MKMKIRSLALILMMSPMIFCHTGENIGVTHFESIDENQNFVVKVTLDEAKVIEELLTTMGHSSVVTLLFKKSTLKKLAHALHRVSSTSFLGYVFQRPHLVQCMKNISESSIKWDNLTRSIVKGLKKEAQNSLFEYLPKFALHTGGDEVVLAELAENGDWNGFILHLVQRH